MRVSTNQYSQMMSGSLSQNSLGINKIIKKILRHHRPTDGSEAAIWRKVFKTEVFVLMF